MTICTAMIGGGPGAMIGEAHRIAARVSGFELVAGAFSSDAEKSRAQAVKSGLEAARGYADWRALIADARALQLDAVIIVTPNHLHAPAAIAALNAGLHVICDKPLCNSLADAHAIAARVQRIGRIFGVTYTYAGYPAIERAAAMVAKGELGDIRLVQAEFIQDWLIKPAPPGMAENWRLDPERAGPAGTTGDLGTHLFHLVGLLTGLRPSAVSADLTAFVAGRNNEDTSLVRLRYPNGARGVFTMTQAAAAGTRGGLSLRVLGSQAGLGWRIEAPHQLEVYRPAAAVEIVDIPRDESLPDIPVAPSGFLSAFARLYRQFAAAIGLERVRYPNVRDGVQGVAFVEAVVVSSEADGAWVPLGAG